MILVYVSANVWRPPCIRKGRQEPETRATGTSTPPLRQSYIRPHPCACAGVRGGRGRATLQRRLLQKPRQHCHGGDQPRLKGHGEESDFFVPVPFIARVWQQMVANILHRPGPVHKRINLFPKGGGRGCRMRGGMAPTPASVLPHGFSLCELDLGEPLRSSL